ncbi:MAG: O-methyltransferase [Chloroflexota bacterium]|nr:O-methyltransferase [Chloroflexota bacterium]
MPAEEPTTPEAVAGWIASAMRRADRFADVYDASERHRLEHGGECDVYPTGSGPLLGALAASTGAKRILEIGCGLGYSTLWLAHGARPDGTVDTCEGDPGHAALAVANISQHALSDRIEIHIGRAAEVLASLRGPYDFVFCDGDPGDYPADLDQVLRLLRPGGTLLTSNLFLGIYVPDAPWLEQSAAYRETLLTHPQLQTAFLPRGMALSVRLR